MIICLYILFWSKILLVLSFSYFTPLFVFRLTPVEPIMSGRPTLLAATPRQSESSSRRITPLKAWPPKNRRSNWPSRFVNFVRITWWVKRDNLIDYILKLQLWSVHSSSNRKLDLSLSISNIVRVFLEA